MLAVRLKLLSTVSPPPMHQNMVERRRIHLSVHARIKQRLEGANRSKLPRSPGHFCEPEEMGSLTTTSCKRKTCSMDSAAKRGADIGCNSINLNDQQGGLRSRATPPGHLLSFLSQATALHSRHFMMCQSALPLPRKVFEPHLPGFGTVSGGASKASIM